MLARRQPSYKRDLFCHDKPENEYGNAADCSPARYLGMANVQRPGTRKELLRQSSRSKNRGPDCVDPTLATERDSGGFRILVTRGESRAADCSPVSGEVTLANYKFDGSENLYAYTTSTGFYARQKYPAKQGKRLSVSPARDAISLKEQQAFTNLKSFLASGNKESHLASIKRSYRATHLPPLVTRSPDTVQGRSTNCRQTRFIRCDADAVREGINEETEEDAL